jgi:N utilization substance protein B
MYRRTLREQIFKLLFRVEFNTPEEMPEQEKLFFDAGDVTYSDKDREEIRTKYEKIREKLPGIDRELSVASEGWDLTRIGKVELTILRVAVYEIEYDATIPEGVAINEAVELAKKFGQDSAPAYVNAVLSKFTEEGRKKLADEKGGKAAAGADDGKKAKPKSAAGPNKPRQGGAKVVVVRHRK